MCRIFNKILTNVLSPFLRYLAEKFGFFGTGANVWCSFFSRPFYPWKKRTEEEDTI